MDNILVKMGTIAVDPLIFALKDSNRQVRNHAAWILGEIGDNRALIPLINAMKVDCSSSEIISEALGKLGVSAVKPLSVALMDKNPTIRSSAAEALGKTNTSGAVEPLIIAMKDEDAAVKKSAIYALVELGIYAVEPLINLLKDKDDEVRRNAAWALEEIDIPDQAIDKGKTFTAIKLDNYVYDPDNRDDELSWTSAGARRLKIDISSDRVAIVASPDPDWTGSEIATFTATDPGGLGCSESVIFTVLPILLGDVNKDGEVRANDANLALQIAAGLASDEYQRLAADMNGDGVIRANDAILILRKAAGLAAPIKDAIAHTGGQITISLDETHGIAGRVVSVPLRVDNTAGLAGGDIHITYDQTVLRAVGVSSDRGVLLASNIAESGVVSIAFASADKLSSKTLAEISFDILSDGVSSLELRSVELYQANALPIGVKKLDGKFSSWAVPPEYNALLQNFSNPFNPDTWIPYQLAQDVDVAIRIYDVSGRLVRELELGHRPAGFYTSKDRAAYWDGRNEAGEQVSSGVYFYTIQAGAYTAMKKMIMAK